MLHPGGCLQLTECLKLRISQMNTKAELDADPRSPPQMEEEVGLMGCLVDYHRLIICHLSVENLIRLGEIFGFECKNL